jgi:carbamoyl-phosphate synthase large subunit
MKRILVGGAGGAPSEGVINSLFCSKQNEFIIGMGSDPTDLILSKAQSKYLVPLATESGYRGRLLDILARCRPNLIHFQNDSEIFQASIIRDDILETGACLFMPDHEVIDTCVYKDKTYLAFQKAGITVPCNIKINNQEDLKQSFSELASHNGEIWLRASSIGGGGKGAIATSDFEMAKAWIDFHNGWGDFLAAEMLTSDTVTWLSIWFEGELVVAQSRKRLGWIHGNRAASGVTGVTKVGVTVDDPLVNEIAINAVRAVSTRPHGIFGVDMTYDRLGVPNPTEINISRFFTTVRFFTEAGLNLPIIFKDLALYGQKPTLDKIMNPLEPDLCWFRGMDAMPTIMRLKDFEEKVATW